MMTITYAGRNSIYVNLTNRCPCACVFCLRHNKDHVFNSDSLWLEREPTVEEICASIDGWDLDKYDEIEEFDCVNRYRYVNVIDQSLPKAIKAIKYMTFLPYATRILNKNKYDFVIVWNDVAIFMFADYLRKKYKGKGSQTEV